MGYSCVVVATTPDDKGADTRNGYLMRNVSAEKERGYLTGY